MHRRSTTDAVSPRLSTGLSPRLSPSGSPASRRRAARTGGSASRWMEPLEARRMLALVAPGLATDVSYGGLISNGTALEFAPDGRLFVTTQNGIVRVIEPGGNLLPTPALTLAVDSFFERGLLGIAFDPAFGVSNDYVYLHYTVPAAQGGPHGRIARFEMNGDIINPASEVQIFRTDQFSAGNHNGGAIHFGPDGKLYAAIGENAVTSNSQSVNNVLGKVLRLNPDPADPIPNDNPTSFIVRQGGVDISVSPTGNNRAIWALGLRNPYTMAFQPGTGRLHVNDVGAASWEEVNLGGAGLNYGWPNTEGNFNQASFPNFTNPLYAYARPPGGAVVGGAFYNPDFQQFPAEYAGDYFFADLSSGWIRRLDAANGYAFQNTGGVGNGPNVVQGGSNITNMRVGPDGALYFLQRGSGNGGAGVRVVRSLNPQVMDSRFDYTAAPHEIRFAFTHPVGASLSTADLVLENLTTSQTIPSGSLALSYSAANVATFTYTGSTDGITGVLPDGNYRATLVGAGITDPVGSSMAADHVFDFFFLNGDANRDGQVNLADFNILAQNFGQSGVGFDGADFNYDGIVNLGDFNLLASRFGAVLSPASTLSGGTRFGESPMGGQQRSDDSADSDRLVDSVVA